MFVDLASQNRILKDPEKVYIGKLANIVKNDETCFTKQIFCSGECVGEF